MAKAGEVTSEVRSCVAHIRGVSPYSASRYYTREEAGARGDKETADVHEERTWKMRLHTDENGQVMLPGMGFKLAVEEAARYLGTKIGGEGKKTWATKLKSAVLVLEDVPTGVHEDEVEGEWLFVPSGGTRGGGKRVMKCFPRLEPGWEAKIEFLILDPIVTEEMFEKFLQEAGKYIGIGRFRPQNGGFYGRFEVLSFKWS